MYQGNVFVPSTLLDVSCSKCVARYECLLIGIEKCFTGPQLLLFELETFLERSDFLNMAIEKMWDKKCLP